jgi:hypothetical protein
LGLDEVIWRMSQVQFQRLRQEHVCEPWVNDATGCGMGFPYGSN